MTRLPEHPLPPKPRWLEPCNGCGLCCHMEICYAGKQAFPGAVAPCPGLVFSEGRTFCALVQIEIGMKLPPIIQDALVIGGGCTMPDSPTQDMEGYVPFV